MSFAGWPTAAIADPIRITGDFRVVNSGADLRDDVGHELEHGDVQNAGDGLASSASVSSRGYFGSGGATLSSSVAPHQISGVGAITAIAMVPSTSESGFVDASASSTFMMTFELDSPHLFVFDGLFTRTAECCGSEQRSHVGFRSFTTLDGVFDHPLVASGQLQENVREQGLLQPGNYRLLVNQDVFVTSVDGSSNTAHGQFSFTFDLSQTPEPASFVLLATGLVGLIRISRGKLTRSQR
jgi:hypothetical protein